MVLLYTLFLSNCAESGMVKKYGDLLESLKIMVVSWLSVCVYRES